MKPFRFWRSRNICPMDEGQLLYKGERICDIGRPNKKTRESMEASWKK